MNSHEESALTTQVTPQLLDPAVFGAMREGNRIINGDMRIDQRQGGASITVTSGSVFCVDRVRAGMSGANGTGQRVASSVTGFPYMLQLTGTAGTTSAWIGQMIESVNTTSLVGQKVTISFYIASSNVTSVTLNLKAATVADNFTSTTTLASTTVTVSSTMTKITYTTPSVLPSTAALGLYLEFVTGSNLATGTFSMTGIQLEAGEIASPFMFRPYGVEVALCQRYYYKANAYPLGVTLNITDGYASVVRLPSPMRTLPTLDAGATYSVGSGSAGTVQLQSGNGEAVLMRNSANNWTANQSLAVTAGFSAELS